MRSSKRNEFHLTKSLSVCASGPRYSKAFPSVTAQAGFGGRSASTPFRQTSLIPTPPKPSTHHEEPPPSSENFRAVAGGTKTPPSGVGVGAAAGVGADGHHGKSRSIDGIMGLPEGYRFGMVGSWTTFC